MEKDAYHEKEMLPEKEEDLHTSSASETFENSGSESFGDDVFKYRKFNLIRVRERQ